MAQPLFIHSNNSSLLTLFNNAIHFSPTSHSNVDIDTQMTEFVNTFCNNEYSAIFIKYSLSPNYLELLGIRLAYHIRFSFKSNIAHLPIIFIGEETIDELLVFSELTDIFSTPGIYRTNENSKFIIQIIDNLISYPGLKLFYDFVNRIDIKPPANYSSHHSLTNEWGVSRMFQLFSLNNKMVEEEFHRILASSTIFNSLYFKLLNARAGAQQKFNTKHRIEPVIKDIQGKKIVYIDDEQGKGWFILFREIFSRSKANLEAYNEFRKSLSKDVMLNGLKSYLERPDISEADLFIIDLRLCDEDFEETEPSELSAILLTNHILKLNPGNQVLIYTASNKVWNFKESILNAGAMGYIIKESPELNYTRDETRMLFRDFEKIVVKACQRSHLKKLYAMNREIKESPYWSALSDRDFRDKVIAKNGWLDQIFSLLQLDSHKTLNQCLLISFQILENYCTLCSKLTDLSLKVFLLEDGKVQDIFNKSGESNLAIIEVLYGTHSFQIGEDRTIININFLSQKKLSTNKFDGLDTKFLVNIASIMHYRHHIHPSKIKMLIELRYLRSNIAAHETGNVNVEKRVVKVEDIHFMIELLQEMYKSK